MASVKYPLWKWQAQRIQLDFGAVSIFSSSSWKHKNWQDQTLILIRRKDSFCLSSSFDSSGYSSKVFYNQHPKLLNPFAFRSFVFFPYSHTLYLIWPPWYLPDIGRFYSEPLIFTWWLRELQLCMINLSICPGDHRASD